jgi:succinoglycan biosynthesis protein ExoM
LLLRRNKIEIAELKSSLELLMKNEHICVCICTYKRPSSLKRLLEGLQLQEIRGPFEFSVVVVDNDCNRSAEHIVAEFQADSGIDVCYYVEPEANISLARNRALELAQGQYLAFIDDDEYPDKNWLSSLYQAQQRFDADAVIGFVQPHFKSEPPQWLLRGRFFFKPVPPLPPSGTPLALGTTSNALVSRAAIHKGSLSFNPALGRSGGEDQKFFTDLQALGFKLIFCGEAIVQETIPAERQSVTYLWKRHHLEGQTNVRIAHIADNGKLVQLAALLKSFAATGVYGLLLPLLVVLGRHMAIRYWLKMAWHLGFIAGSLHWQTLWDRGQFEAYMQSTTIIPSQLSSEDD